MAHTYRLIQARTAFGPSAVSTSVTMQLADTAVAVLIKVTGATPRLSVAPTIGGLTMSQANSAQFAAASPEGGVELWYYVNPNLTGSQTLDISDGNGVSGFYTVVAGQSATGSSAFQGANGANGTSTNPAPGSVTPSAAGDIGFAIVASGATTWSPSAQVGTAIANTDDGAHGGGEQRIITANNTAVNLGWTFATSDDWGAVSAFFKEVAVAPIPKRTVMAGQAVKRASYY